MYPTKESIQSRIRPLAEEKGLTLKGLCRECGLGVNTLYQGDNLTARSLVAIADYLDCSIDYILGREDRFTQFGELCIFTFFCQEDKNPYFIRSLFLFFGNLWQKYTNSHGWRDADCRHPCKCASRPFGNTRSSGR